MLTQRVCKRVQAKLIAVWCILFLCPLPVNSLTRTMYSGRTRKHSPRAGLLARFRYSTAQGVGDQPFWADFTVSMFTSCLAYKVTCWMSYIQADFIDLTALFTSAEQTLRPFPSTSLPLPPWKNERKTERKERWATAPLPLCSHHYCPK